MSASATPIPPASSVAGGSTASAAATPPLAPAGPQLLPPLPANTLPQPSSSDQTAILAFATAQAQVNAYNWNKNLADLWNSYFRNWLGQYMNAAYPFDANPLPPPRGFMVQTDPSIPFAFSYPQLGNPVHGRHGG